jgi:hypothetical protein
VDTCTCTVPGAHASKLGIHVNGIIPVPLPIKEAATWVPSVGERPKRRPFSMKGAVIVSEVPPVDGSENMLL